MTRAGTGVRVRVRAGTGVRVRVRAGTRVRVRVFRSIQFVQHKITTAAVSRHFML